MRALGITMAAVAILLSAPADGVAQEALTGPWDLTVQTDQGDNVIRINIVQDGGALTATGDIPELGPIEMAGTIDGADIHFEWELDLQGTLLPITLMGTLADDGTISGTADFAGQGGGAWTAKRVGD